MPNATTNYGLTKPLPTKFYDIAVFNANADKIDTTMKDIDDGVTERIKTAIGDAMEDTY